MGSRCTGCGSTPEDENPTSMVTHAAGAPTSVITKKDKSKTTPGKRGKPPPPIVVVRSMSTTSPPTKTRRARPPLTAKKTLARGISMPSIHIWSESEHQLYCDQARRFFGRDPSAVTKDTVSPPVAWDPRSPKHFAQPPFVSVDSSTRAGPKDIASPPVAWDPRSPKRFAPPVDSSTRTDMYPLNLQTKLFSIPNVPPFCQKIVPISSTVSSTITAAVSDQHATSLATIATATQSIAQTQEQCSPDSTLTVLISPSTVTSVTSSLRSPLSHTASLSTSTTMTSAWSSRLSIPTTDRSRSARSESELISEPSLSPSALRYLHHPRKEVDIPSTEEPVYGNNPVKNKRTSGRRSTKPSLSIDTSYNNLTIGSISHVATTITQN